MNVRQLDVALFVENAAWCVSHLRDPTIEGLLTWCARWLRPDRVAAWRALVQLDLPARVEGEVAIVSTLDRVETNLPRRMVNGWRVSETIERSVDWARTYALAEGNPHLRLHHRIREWRVDRDAVEALLGLAAAWATALSTWGSGPGHAARRAVLAGRVARFAAEGYAPGPWNDRALDGVGDVDVADRRRIHLARRPLRTGAGEGHRTLAEQLTDTAEAMRIQACNQDDLFELSFRLAVARAATVAPGRGTWHFARPLDDASGNKTVDLRRGGLRCRLYKGRPDGTADRLVPNGAHLGLAPRGNEPDLVVDFTHDAVPGARILVLGDAKRNASADGRGYLAAALEVAAVYAVSYGHGMALSLADGAPTGVTGLFVGPVTPAVTLFTLQAPRREDGTSARPVDQVHRELLSAGPLPFCLALDAEQCFPPGRPEPSAVLRAWIDRIADQAESHLVFHASPG